MTLSIVKYGEKVLRQKGVPVRQFDSLLKQLSSDMLVTMEAAEGIGLAAQQIGKALQFCVVDVPDHPEHPMDCILDGKPLSPSLLMPMSLANPVVKTLPSDEFYYEEGCLSFPGINADVARPERIEVTYQDLDGVTHTLECDGLLARCIQHEVDHLNGVLFIDRMEKPTYAEIKKDVQSLKQETLDRLRAGSQA